MVKVKMNEDMPLSPDGINVISAKAGEEHTIELSTAETLVAEGKADFSGKPIVKLQDRIDAGLATANEINPMYGDANHVAAVLAETAEDPNKVVADRKKKAKEEANRG